MKTSKPSSKQSSGKDATDKTKKRSQDTAGTVDTPANDDCKTKPAPPKPLAEKKKDNAKGRKSSKPTSSAEPAPAVEVKSKTKKSTKVIAEKPATAKTS